MVEPAHHGTVMGENNDSTHSNTYELNIDEILHNIVIDSNYC